MAKIIDGNQVLEDLKRARNKTPKHFGTISSNGKVLATAQGNKPFEGNTFSPKPLSQKEQFLKQIRQYNDFIIQNDLDADSINPDHDYDFSAFTSPEDWDIESERVADRLSDRKMEIAQNTNNGQFQNMELENGVPSYEAVQNMDDEQFKEYEKKYLLPSKDETLKEPVQQIKQIKAKSIGGNVTGADTKIPGSAERKLPLNVSKQNIFKTPNTVDGITVPADVASRVTDKPFDAFSLNGVRDFVQDGLGSLIPGREGRDRRYLSKDLYVQEEKRKLRNVQFAKAKAKTDQQELDQVRMIREKVAEEPKTKYDRSFSTIVRNALPFPLKGTYDTGSNAIDSIQKIREQSGKHNTARSLGVGLAEGLAGRTGDVLDLGGLLKNPVADTAHQSADWWKSKQELQGSEVGSVGRSVGGDAVLGVLGGAVGKGLGSIYKGMRKSAEGARDKIIRLADEEAVKKAGHTKDTDAIDLERLKQYEAKTGTKPPDPYSLPLTKVDKLKQFMRGSKTQDPYDYTPSWVKGVDKVANGIKKEYGTTGMIRKNDAQLNDMFEKVGDLNKARAAQQNQWNNLPHRGAQVGGVTGFVIGGDDTGGDDTDDTGSSTVGKHPNRLVNPMKKKGVGSMKNNGRVSTSGSVPGI